MRTLMTNRLSQFLGEQILLFRFGLLFFFLFILLPIGGCVVRSPIDKKEYYERNYGITALPPSEDLGNEFLGNEELDGENIDNSLLPENPPANNPVFNEDLGDENIDNNLLPENPPANNPVFNDTTPNTPEETEPELPTDSLAQPNIDPTEPEVGSTDATALTDGELPTTNEPVVVPVPPKSDSSEEQSNNQELITPELDKAEYQGNSLEENLWLAIKKTFTNRDQDKFFVYSNFFLKNFPQSRYFYRVQGFVQEFYHPLLLNKDLLAGNWVSLEAIKAPITEFALNIDQIKKFNITTILFAAFENGSNPKTPYFPQLNQWGAFFQSTAVPMVNESLPVIIKAVKEKGLRFFAQVPIRNHPWLLFQNSQLMDQVYDPVRDDFHYNSKLNLLHQQTASYLNQIVDNLGAYAIDGIVFDMDYTMTIEEGFSSYDAIVYEHETGKKLNYKKFPPSLWQNNNRSAAWQADSLPNEYLQFNQWRRDKIHLVLLNLVKHIRNLMPVLKVGIRLPAKMFNPQPNSEFIYGIQPKQIFGLPVHFFIITPPIHKSIVQTEQQDQAQKMVVQRINQFAREMDDSQKIILAGSGDTKNELELSDILQYLNRLQWSQKKVQNILLGPFVSSSSLPNFLATPSMSQNEAQK